MILVTGAAGFIGSFVTKRLLDKGEYVTGIDNLNDYYDVNLKRDRLKNLQNKNFRFHEIDISDGNNLNKLFEQYKPHIVIHLAAQAGVRYSLNNPHAYIDSNIVGFMNILEACRKYPVDHLIYASSSSVYGANKKIPFAVQDRVDHPVSLYAATKKSNELMAHTYSHLFGVPTTGLRFFTVYGPWGRPDMAYFSFTQSILKGIPIKVFNNGDMRRDFTYIDDIVQGIIQLLGKVPNDNRLTLESSDNTNPTGAPYALYNIGNNKPVELLEFIRIIERQLTKEAIIEFHPMQDGDVKETFADISALQRDTGFVPTTSIEEGLKKFVEWYREYYSLVQK
ncbi:NAD-dependent epimerase [Paenibacillus chitinolyticus]|uniref:NAD-dependent epimerase n=1 Tax=Paenibacillus chitinolyticus TaxID=79263 RepID=UPI0038673B50